MSTIAEIEGIGPVYADKLNKADVKTVESLLEKGASKSGRKVIADASGIAEGTILDWVNMADLFRVKGVAGEMAELMKAAGVDTVKELRTRNSENLYSSLKDVNEKKNLVRRLPSADQVADFVEQAKKLDPKVTY